MPLIDVDTRMFDPERRPEALLEAAAAQGFDYDEEDLAGVLGFLDAVFPDAPEDVADFLAVVSKYLAMVVVSAFSVQQQFGDVNGRLQALED